MDPFHQLLLPIFLSFIYKLMPISFSLICKFARAIPSTERNDQFYNYMEIRIAAMHFEGVWFRG